MNAPRKLDEIREEVETMDGKVDAVSAEVKELKTNTKWGFIVFGILLGSPKVGGPSAQDVVGALFRFL